MHKHITKTRQSSGEAGPNPVISVASPIHWKLETSNCTTFTTRYSELPLPFHLPSLVSLVSKFGEVDSSLYINVQASLRLNVCIRNHTQKQTDKHNTVLRRNRKKGQKKSDLSHLQNQ